MRKQKSEMPCNKPMKSWLSGKKMVVKACEGGKEKIIHFGDASMKDFRQHKSKTRRLSYCKRSGGIKGTDTKLSANYWSRKVLWSCGQIGK
jgi:hypothetical protein